MIDDYGTIMYEDRVRSRLLFIYFFAPLVPFPGVNFFGNGKKTIKNYGRISPLAPAESRC